VPVCSPMGPPRLQGDGTREARQDDRGGGFGTVADGRSPFSSAICSGVLPPTSSGSGSRSGYGPSRLRGHLNEFLGQGLVTGVAHGGCVAMATAKAARSRARPLRSSALTHIRTPSDLGHQVAEVLSGATPSPSGACLLRRTPSLCQEYRRTRPVGQERPSPASETKSANALQRRRLYPVRRRASSSAHAIPRFRPPQISRRRAVHSARVTADAARVAASE
jgi:hypothetical protein